jgi:uncharacterized protein (TIGR04255 family)
MTTYFRNFITKVIAKVDFQPILKLKNEEPAAFQEAIREQFPRFRQKASMDIAIKPGEDFVTTKRPITWQFGNKEKNISINLNFQVISLTLEKYESFESFYSNIELMYNTFNGIYNPALIKRIGLRFINEINLKGDPFDWDGYINDKLYAIIMAFPDFQKSVTRAMSQMHLNFGDRTLLFQFGIFNSQYPNYISQKEFILDYDCVCREECEPDAVLSKFKILYEDIKNVFKKCRGEKLLKIMRGEDI